MIGTPARGWSTHEYFLTCAEARREVVAAGERDRDVARLFRDLFTVLGDLEIVAVDCGTARGLRVRRRPDGDDARGSLARRIDGFVIAEAVVDRTGEVIATAGTLITPALAQRIEGAQVVSVMVRDVRACEARGGVCARCFGLAPEDAIWTSVGDGVGARACEAIAEAARRLPKDLVFHIC
jgi:DNA-directed RNA polymerase subunit beta'